MTTSAPLLRIMTLKSKLNFGKYENLTIQEIINLRHTQYLRYVYYSFEGLSFNEEVLKLIGVINEFNDNRITKPGVDLELHKYINSRNERSRIERIGYFVVNGQKTVEKKLRMKQLTIFNKVVYSKAAMQGRNQGKGRLHL
jgi:hypothetical protein